MSIDKLKIDEEGVITNCNNSLLMDHGFVKGTPFKVYAKASDITCIYIRGAILACRDSNCDCINVKKL